MGSTTLSSCTIKEGRILDANPAACRQLGYSRRVAGHDDQPDRRPRIRRGFSGTAAAAARGEGTLSCEGLHRTKNGRIIPVEVTTSTIQFDHQVAVLAILRDITERKALERTRREFAAAQMRNAQEMEFKNRALSESEARYRQLAEGSLDAIVVADGEGRINLFNPAAEKIFGYESRQVLDQPLERLIPGDLPGRGRTRIRFRRLPVGSRQPAIGNAVAVANLPGDLEYPAVASTRQRQPAIRRSGCRRSWARRWSSPAADKTAPSSRWSSP